MSQPSARSSLAMVFLTLIVLSAFRIHALGMERRALRADVMELSHITYGLFDPSQWKIIIGAILERKVTEFEITDANREQIRKRMTDVMHGLLNEVEQVMEERNKDKGFTGLMRNVLMDVLVDVDDIRSGIPRYADMMLDYVNDPRNKEEIQCFIIEQLDALERKTEGMVDRTLFEQVMEKHAAHDHSALIADLRARMHRSEQAERSFLIIMGIACISSFMLSVRTPATERLPLITLLLAAIVLLINGLMLPMIDIEASIAEFSMTLIGEAVTFRDQVLFHQSKSILEVVDILLSDGALPLAVVAVLVFAFSVLIPVSKVLLSLVTLIRRREPRSKLARWLVFQAGKWSMADVLVVAIFMAFIGFSGVIDGQLGDLEEFAGSIHILTTNNSSLEVGFYLFTSYCLLGLGSAVLVQRAMPAASAPRT